MLHIPRRHSLTRKPWTIIGLFCIPLEFQPKMKNWIYRHSTGFLNYTSVLTNSVILLGLPNDPRNLFPNYINIYSISGLHSYCDTSYPRSGVNQTWFLKNYKDMLRYLQSMSLSSRNNIKRFDFPTLYTAIFT